MEWGVGSPVDLLFATKNMSSKAAYHIFYLKPTFVNALNAGSQQFIFISDDALVFGAGGSSGARAGRHLAPGMTAQSSSHGCLCLWGHVMQSTAL